MNVVRDIENDEGLWIGSLEFQSTSEGHRKLTLSQVDMAIQVAKEAFIQALPQKDLNEPKQMNLFERVAQ